MRGLVVAALLWAGAAHGQTQEDLPTDAARLREMHHIGQSVAWAHRCHFQEAAINLVSDRAMARALRFLSANAEKDAMSALDDGMLQGQRSHWPTTEADCKQVVEDFGALSTRSGVTSAEIRALLAPRR